MKSVLGRLWRSVRGWGGALGGVSGEGVGAADATVRRTRRPAAIAVRTLLGFVGFIALIETVGAFIALAAAGGACSPSLSLISDIEDCAWVLVWAYTAALGVIIALAVPSALLGVPGLQGARAILLSVPFTAVTMLGLGLLVSNLGPLGALLSHEDAGGFFLASVLLATGVPFVVALTWRLRKLGKAARGKTAGSPGV